MASSPGQPPEISTMLYRITALEEQIKHLQEQLKAYVPARENELQLRNIQDSVTRIERDVIDMKARQENLEKEARLHDDQQKESQAKLQIRTLIGIVTTIVTIISGIIIGYVTHILH